MKKVTTLDFIEKAKIIHNNKYNYSLVNYVKAKTKIIILCPIHGKFEQMPDTHINGGGCKICSGNVLLTTNNFIEKANLKHGDKYNYSLVEYFGAKIKIKILCSKHGLFTQTPTNHLCGQGCPKCSNNILFTTDEFILKANLKHNYIFNYSLIYKLNKKVKIICPLHGIFEQISKNHLRGDGCPTCSGNKKLTTEEFINKSKLKHGEKYDYSLVNYINNSKKVIIICEKHGEFIQAPNCHLNGSGCITCRHSKGEKLIKKFLLENKIKHIPQKRFKDCKYLLPLPFDFYLPDYNICIEYNGRQHYESIKSWGGDIEFKKRQFKDKIKMDYCINKNIQLLIIKYNEIILTKLKHYLI